MQAIREFADSHPKLHVTVTDDAGKVLHYTWQGAYLWKRVELFLDETERDDLGNTFVKSVWH